MSIRAIILTRNKRVIKKDIGFYDDEREIEGYDYWLDPNLIANKIEGNSLKDQEVIYFEGNPTPIILVDELKPIMKKDKIDGYEKTGKKILWDNSPNILGDVVRNNFAKQTSGYKKKRVNNRLIVYLLIGFVIVSSLLWLFAFGGLKTLGL
jgi:hypothetical protein